MRVEDILPKEDSFEKLQAIQGKPEKNFIFAPEFNAVVKTLKEIKEEVEKPKVEAILTPEAYGAKGDGVSDDTAALNACFDEARIKGAVIFLKNKYFVKNTLDASNLIIISDDAEISSDNNSYVIRAAGTRTAYMRISESAVINKGEAFFQMQNATQMNVLNLKPGDLIKIRSMGVVYDSALALSSPGEIVEVHSVVGTQINIKGTFEGNYTGLAANQTEIAKINYATFTNIGQLKLRQDGNTLSSGIDLAFCKDPVVDIKTFSCHFISVNVMDCFRAQIRAFTDNSNSPDLGYGVAIINASMYSKVTGMAQGARHAIATGANGSERGVSWGTVVSDFVGISSTSLAIFDAHASTGSIRYERCRAKGVLNRFGATLLPVGFQLNTVNYEIVDCDIEDCINGINMSKPGRIHENVTIENVRFKNIIRHLIFVGNASFVNLKIKNLTSVCGSFLSPNGFDSVAINIQPTTNQSILNLVIEDLYVVNHQCVVAINANCTFSNGLKIVNVRHEYTLQPPNAINTYNNVVRVQNSSNLSLTLDGITAINTALLSVHSSSVVNTITIVNSRCVEPRRSVIWIEPTNVPEVMVTNCEFQCTIAGITSFILRCTNITDFIFGNNILKGNSLFGIFSSGGVITHFYESLNILNSSRFNNNGVFDNNINPTNWYLGGNRITNSIMKGVNLPEGATTARPGTIFLRTNGEMYLKTTGTGNTGWTLK